MASVARTRLLTDTSLNGVNRNAGTITAYRLVSAGTPVANENAINGANVGGAAKLLGAIQEDVAPGATATVYGPGSIVQLENDGTAVINYGEDVVVVVGGSLAASGRVKTLPGTTGAYTKVGKCMSTAQIPATAGAKLLVRLCEPTTVNVA